MESSFFTKCLRCNGAVIYDKFYGPSEQYWGWKCLICGEIVDPVILANRKMMQSYQDNSVHRAKQAKGYGGGALRSMPIPNRSATQRQGERK
jgi:hypothetical protein